MKGRPGGRAPLGVSDSEPECRPEPVGTNSESECASESTPGSSDISRVLVVREGGLDKIRRGVSPLYPGKGVVRKTRYNQYKFSL